MRTLCETVGPFSENTYFIVDEASRETVVIDPGDEADRLLDLVRREDLTVRWILCTHGHLDHVGAVAPLQKATGAPFHIHRSEVILIENLPAQGALFGVEVPETPRIDGFLEGGQVLHFGDPPAEIRVIETPGHSPGGVTLEAGGRLFVGDVLFQGSVGRTDLFGGDSRTLIRSIRDRLLVFPDPTPVEPGHGPSTTIGRERRSNPFLDGL